jgi:hypothetical protein
MRVNLTFSTYAELAVLEAAAAAQKMPLAAWAKSRLLLAAEREGFTADIPRVARVKKPAGPALD